MRYAAFLRGINISGKNKIPMADLKAGIEALGLSDVKTYLNSGNVAFSADQEDADGLADQLEAMLYARFALSIPVFVIAQEALADILEHAPAWWGLDDKAIYHNLIFIIRPTSLDEVLAALGEPKADLEQIQTYKAVIFWSFDRVKYQKTNWWHKTAADDIGRQLTIRTAGTVRKLCEW